MTRGLTAAIVMFTLACGCSGSDAAQPGADATFPDAALAVVTGDLGRLGFEVRTAPDQPPQRGTIAVDYRVSAAGAPVDGLSISVVPWMPAMGHGSSITPDVHAMGGGRYVITNVDLFMPGRWELKTTFSGTLDDHATPAFDIP